MTRELPKRTYGKTGVQMPILALGGAGVLQDASRTAEAIAIIREAVEQGVYYLDTAQQYHDSERIFGEAIDGIRNKVFLSTKSARRDYDGYALSHPIHTAVISPNSLRELRELLAAARAFTPMTPDEMRALEARAKPLTDQVAGMYHQWP